MPWNTGMKNTALDAVGTSYITHVGVHQLTDPGVGVNATGTEATGGSPAYARLPVTWSAAATMLKPNSAALTFDVPAGTYAFFTYWNALTGNTNNYRGYAPFGGAAATKGFASVDTTLANSNFFSRVHGMADGDRVIVYPVFAETLVGGLTTGTAYFVVNSTADTFKLSATSGGAPLTLSAVNGGEFYFQKVIPEVFGAQGQLTVAAGALVLDLSAF